MTVKYIEAAFSGNLVRFMAEELEDAEWAVTEGIREGAEDLLFDLRTDVIAGGLGARVSKSWRVDHYPRGKRSLGAASVVRTKSPKIIRAFDEGAVIRSKDGFWLAIPTEAAPKRGRNRKRINPSNFPDHIYGPLRFVYRPSGVSLLVVDNQRVKKGKRPGYTLSKSKRALKTGYGLSTVIMFTLHQQVRMKRRLNVQPIMESATRKVGSRIDRAFSRRDAIRKRR